MNLGIGEVQGSGFRVRGLGVWGLGRFGVQGSGFRVRGLGVWGLGFGEVPGVLNIEYRTPNN